MLKHERLVHLLPALLDPSAHHPVDDQPLDRHTPPRRRSRTERPRLRSAGAPTKRDRVAVDELILDRDVKIGKGQQEARDELLPRTDASERFWSASDVDDAVRTERLVGGRDVTTIEALDPDPLVFHQRGNRHIELRRKGKTWLREQHASTHR